jgi:hypothetical protein
MTATFSVAMHGREEPRRAGAGRGWWWSVCRGGGFLADGGAGGRFVDDGLAGGAGGQERGDGEPVDGPGQVAGCQETRACRRAEGRLTATP